MRSVRILLVLAVMSIAAVGQSVPDAPKLKRFDPAQIDTSLDPCTDFFQYSCSKWMKANPIPPDLPSFGTGTSLALWNFAAVHDTLEQVTNSSANRTPAEQKIGDYYATCMDEAAVNKAGLAPLQPMLDRIAKFNDKAQLPELIAAIHQRIRPANLNFIDAQYQGVLFGIFAGPDLDDATVNLAVIDQSGMNLPAREFYLKDDEKSKQIREDYQKHVARMLQLSGETAEQASADAKAVMALETAFANAAMDIVVRRDPKNVNNKMSLEQVQALTPSFNWSRYFAAVRAPAAPKYQVTAPEFLRGVEKLIVATPVEQWRAYLRYSVVHLSAPFLSEAFVNENFDFYGRQLNGAQKIQPRQRRCSFNTDTDLGEAIGQAYVKRYFPPENKARMLEMVKAIEVALNEDIENSSWMSAKTKKLAHEKLAAQVDKIGYPDEWIDYSSLEIKRGDFLGNVQRASAFELNRRMKKFGKPVDRHEWAMTPPTVNAYEDPQTNTINFPAGILQPPFFDVSQLDAVNFGAIGAVIGHEIIHGYDDQGRKFDANGNLRDWWTAEDAANYDQRDECITEEYTQDVPEAGVKQNGKLSAGEDTADNGGIHIALGGLQQTLQSKGKTLDSPAEGGLTQLQTFFVSYANAWCGQLRPEAARTAVMSQGHSLNRYRVNNVVSNMPEFAHAFSCKVGQPMVRAKACRVW